MAASTTTTGGTTTTAPPGPPSPLTGLPRTEPGAATRPAVVIKLDNAREVARPHVGINQADVVFEIQAEGVSRYAAVFHSATADPVGPVRSGRTGDIDIVSQFSNPLFKCSGANDITITALNRAKTLVNLCGERADTVRDPDRPAPHNLFTNVSAQWEKALPEQGPPAPVFSYRGPADPAPAGPVPGTVSVRYDGTRTAWDWDATTKRWLRTLDSTPHVDDKGNPVAPANVVIVFTQYRINRDTGSTEAISVGSGKAWVLTGGVLVAGTWNRERNTEPYRLTDASGKPILLSPGQTWVQLPRPGDGTTERAGV
ncbi:MAG: DUF3048 domain-containing protein [Acidimicrobiales bacterium]